MYAHSAHKIHVALETCQTQIHDPILKWLPQGTNNISSFKHKDCSHLYSWMPLSTTESHKDEETVAWFRYIQEQIKCG